MIRGLALVLLASCGLEVEHPEPSATSHVIRFEVPTPSVKPIDVLFVLDESPAMAAEHARMVASMAGFSQAFEAKLAGQDLNLGVITTDPSDHGELVGGGFLHERSTIAAIERDFDGALADRLTTLADHEQVETAPNMVLDAIVQAIDPMTNPGFRRDGATLLLVVITNRDDQSLGAIADYQPLAIAANRRSSLVLVDRYPSPRLDAFSALYGSFPEVGSFLDVTDVGFDRYDVGAELAAITLLGPRWRGTPCLDRSAATPHDCTISDITNGIETAELLECANDSLPCWRFESAPQQCSGDPGLIVRVDRAVFPPPNTWIRGQCVSETPSN